LDCSGARLVNDSGPALDADSLQVGHGMFLNNGFQAIASSDLAAVRLLSAHIAVLDCDTARLVNDSGPALHADNLRVDHGMYLRGGFQATGSSELGAVRLIGAHLGGQLDCSGARLVNDSGPALHADNLQVDHGMYLRGGFQATGSSELGAVRLIGAHLGMLDCETARLVNDSGPALNADRLRVDQSMFLGNDFQATASGDDVVLHLSDTHIGGVLFVSPNSLEHRTHPHHKLRLDGLTYTGLPQGVTPDQWLALLRHDTVDYAAQPYQHLAAAHRAAGHDREARHVLIAQRQDQIRRHALTGRTTRMWARLTGLLLGYGYKPWRALIALAAVLAAAVVAAVILGGTYGALAQTRTPPTATPVPCTWVEHVGVGLDLGTPLLTTGTRTRCDTTNTTPGHILTITGWTLRLLAWAFATLFIAGFTGAVRKT
ncbi:Membrane-associated oxidoreductase, partial [Kibdelosporangium sp. 4NS15]|nr:Membrane-associated oxidoreductase [Kibdelosporangium persicum]